MYIEEFNQSSESQKDEKSLQSIIVQIMDEAPPEAARGHMRPHQIDKVTI